MQIGDKVWIFDSNRRQYHDDKGNKLDRCWFKYYFKDQIILGETKQSWIVGSEYSNTDSKSNYKVNKKTLTYTYGYGHDGILYTSEEQVNQLCWMNDNHYKISEMVRNCKNYDKIRKIEEILNQE